MNSHIVNCLEHQPGSLRKPQPARACLVGLGRSPVIYSFLFMRANGDQLREITALIDSQVVHPVMDRVFPFESTREAMAYLEKGRAKGKVVVKVR